MTLSDKMKKKAFDTKKYKNYKDILHLSDALQIAEQHAEEEKAGCVRCVQFNVCPIFQRWINEDHEYFNKKEHDFGCIHFEAIKGAHNDS